MSSPYKVVGMFSGGLDSILAHRIMVLEGFEVIALHFHTGFNGNIADEIERGSSRTWTPPKEVEDSARNLGARFLPMNIGGGEYLDILSNPRYGYGSAANPCIDCRIFLLKKAREVMEAEGAVLVFTGEVLGQRPMSQHRPAMNLAKNKSGLEGRLLRPLSAKLFEPTIPETEGIVNRDHLYGFSGRSRKPQKELACRLGIEKYPPPAGGCLLTDESFGRRFHDLRAHLCGNDLTIHDLNTLKTGRHLRFPGGLKIVIGRNEKENEYFEGILRGRAWAFDARDFSGATAFAIGEPDNGDFLRAGAITARYSKGRERDRVIVVARRGDEIREFTVTPAKQEEIDPLLIF